MKEGFKKYIFCCFTLGLIIFCNLASNSYSQTIFINNQINLQEISQKKIAARTKEREMIVTLASKLNIPIRKIYSDGTIIELQKFQYGKPIYYITNNFISAKTISTEKVWNNFFSGYSLSGDGIILGIWDGGAVRTSHQEFNRRVTQFDDADSLGDHATHVAGTMVASGIEPEAKGMAFKAQLQAYDWNNDESEMGFAAASGLLVSNHSYGIITGWYKKEDSLWTWFGDSSISSEEDFNFGFYSDRAALWDTIAWYAPNYLIVKSAGNDRGNGPAIQPVKHWEFVDTSKALVSEYRPLDGGTEGYDCLTDKSTAKNILTVGAVWDMSNGYSHPGDVLMASMPNWGSSWGPTDDGRIKPDLMANGTHLYSSTASSDHSYDYYSGSSMASPSVAGSIALMLEYHKILSDSSTLRSSTVKALLIHTADEAGPNPGPDYMFGWGLMNTYKAVKVLSINNVEPDINFIGEVPINTGDSYKLSYYCSSETELRATICWTDPPGVPPKKSLDPKDIMLINDLDLRIIGPQNETYFPWILDPDQPHEKATTGDNLRDNVEQIIIEKPVAGIYTIKITPKNDIQFGPQIVSVIVSTAKEKIKLNAPKNGFENITLNPTLWWQEIDEIASYNLQISTTEDFSSNVLDSSNIKTNFFSIDGLSKNTTYFWRVSYTDSIGTSDWSIPWHFVTGEEYSIAKYALWFDGEDDFVEVPNSNVLNQIEILDKITIEAWISVHGWNNGMFSIIDKYMPSIDWGWTLQISQHNGINLNLIWSNITFSYVPEMHTWNHIAVAYDRSEGKTRLFINGKLESEKDFFGDIPETQVGDPLYIGYNPSGDDEFSNGIIDELRIWNIARTEQQIQENMYKKLSINESNLIANFQLDEGEGFSISDATGNINNGRFHHEPIWLYSTTPFEITQKPNLKLPENNAENISINPILEWIKSPLASTYQLQISLDSTFLNFFIQDSTLTNSLLALDGLQKQTKYFWRVRAKNLYGYSGWSETWNFTTNPPLPDSVILIYPEKNQFVSNNSINFVWNSSQSDVTEYLFELSTDSNMSNPFDSTVTDTTLILSSLLSNEDYWWQVKAKNQTGWGPYSENRKFTTNLTNVSDNTTIPINFNLNQNHPNPFNETTTIRFDLAKESHVTLKIFNTLGKLEVTILDKQFESGKYSILFSGRNLPSGIYFYQIRTDQFIQTKKALLLK